MPKCIDCELLKERVEGVCKQGPREYLPGYVFCKFSGREIMSNELYSDIVCAEFIERVKKPKRTKNTK